MNAEVAQEIADVVRRRYSTCTADDVLEVSRTGSVSEGIIGPDYDEALADAILAEMDERGIEVRP